VRALSRNVGSGNNPSNFRVLQEALPYLRPYLGASRVPLGPEDLHTLLQCEHIAIAMLSPDLHARLLPLRTSPRGARWTSGNA
jgi:hypothetical protein